MTRILRPRPSASMRVAILAACSSPRRGGVKAASVTLVTGAQIEDGSITGADGRNARSPATFRAFLELPCNVLPDTLAV